MKNTRYKKILLSLAGVITVLAIVLCVHIYQVTHKKITDPNAIALARIDFTQSFSKEDATKFYAWFIKQNGVNRVAFNTENQNAVLAYYPLKVDATKLTETFCRQFNVNAKRYVPSKQEMMQGCPVAEIKNNQTENIYYSPKI